MHRLIISIIYYTGNSRSWPGLDQLHPLHIPVSRIEEENVCVALSMSLEETCKQNCTEATKRWRDISTYGRHHKPSLSTSKETRWYNRWGNTHLHLLRLWPCDMTVWPQCTLPLWCARSTGTLCRSPRLPAMDGWHRRHHTARYT